jgi:hypothetical protein
MSSAVRERSRSGPRRTPEPFQDRRTLAALGTFAFVLVPFGIISLWYNDVRFGSLFDTGLDEIYDKYAGYGYT